MSTPIAVTPLDPTTDKGREVAARITRVYAEVRLAIAQRAASATSAATAGVDTEGQAAA